MTETEWGELLRQLSEPFPDELLKWRAGSLSRDRTRAQALPYVEPREYERRLDELAPGGWGVDFAPSGDRLVCRLTLRGLTRSSTGGAEKGDDAEARAFERACGRFGLGRYLSGLPTPWVAYDRERRVLAGAPRVPAATAPPETLSRARAEALHRQLGRLGLRRDGQYELCERALGREVKTLTALTEAEAALVRGLAGRGAASPGTTPVSDAEALAVLN